MRVFHVFLLVLVMAAWGFSFIAIKEGLKDSPPLLLCSLRFFLTTFPAIFFIKKPKTSWSILLSYSVLMFVLMFALAFLSLNAGLSPGLASLLLQFQILFTLLLSWVFLKEALNRWQTLGILISFSGLLWVVFQVDGKASLLGLILILCSALAWGFANLISKKAGKINMLALTVWGSAFAWPILFLISLVFEGTGLVFQSLKTLSWTSWGALFYMAYPATIFGFSLWTWLLNRYPANVVTPFALLVPFFGMLGAFLFFSETLESWKIFAAFLVMMGLSLHFFGQRLSTWLSRRIKGRRMEKQKVSRSN